jgi:hypothetical protein
MTRDAHKTKFIPGALVLLVLLTFGSGVPVFANEEMRYEYKIVRLGSLSSLQEKSKADAKMGEIEEILNKEGAQGWEIVNIFAVRTTFDPNVFFVAMKRQLRESKTEGSK